MAWANRVDGEERESYLESIKDEFINYKSNIHLLDQVISQHSFRPPSEYNASLNTRRATTALRLVQSRRILLKKTKNKQ